MSDEKEHRSHAGGDQGLPAHPSTDASTTWNVGRKMLLAACYLHLIVFGPFAFWVAIEVYVSLMSVRPTPDEHDYSLLMVTLTTVTIVCSALIWAGCLVLVHGSPAGMSRGAWRIQRAVWWASWLGAVQILAPWVIESGPRSRNWWSNMETHLPFLPLVSLLTTCLYLRALRDRNLATGMLSRTRLFDWCLVAVIVFAAFAATFGMPLFILLGIPAIPALSLVTLVGLHRNINRPTLG